MARKNAEKNARGFSGGGRGMSERTEWLILRIVAPLLLSASIFLGVLAPACLD